MFPLTRFGTHCRKVNKSDGILLPVPPSDLVCPRLAPFLFFYSKFGTTGTEYVYYIESLCISPFSCAVHKV